MSRVQHPPSCMGISSNLDVGCDRKVTYDGEISVRLLNNWFRIRLATTMLPQEVPLAEFETDHR